MNKLTKFLRAGYHEEHDKQLQLISDKYKIPVEVLINLSSWIMLGGAVSSSRENLPLSVRQFFVKWIPTSVKLYRGINNNEEWETEPFNGKIKEGMSLTYSEKVFTSWTSHQEVARIWSSMGNQGYVMSHQFEAKDVFIPIAELPQDLKNVVDEPEERFANTQFEYIIMPGTYDTFIEEIYS